MTWPAFVASTVLSGVLFVLGCAVYITAEPPIEVVDTDKVCMWRLCEEPKARCVAAWKTGDNQGLVAFIAANQTGEVEFVCPSHEERDE